MSAHRVFRNRLSGGLDGTAEEPEYFQSAIFGGIAGFETPNRCGSGALLEGAATPVVPGPMTGEEKENCAPAMSVPSVCPPANTSPQQERSTIGAVVLAESPNGATIVRSARAHRLDAASRVRATDVFAFPDAPSASGGPRLTILHDALTETSAAVPPPMGSAVAPPQSNPRSSFLELAVGNVPLIPPSARAVNGTPSRSGGTSLGADSPSKDFEASLCFDLFDDDEDNASSCSDGTADGRCSDIAGADSDGEVGHVECEMEHGASGVPPPLEAGVLQRCGSNPSALVGNDETDAPAAVPEVASSCEDGAIVEASASPKRSHSSGLAGGLEGAPLQSVGESAPTLVRAVTQAKVCASVRRGISERLYLQPNTRRIVASAKRDEGSGVAMGRVPWPADLPLNVSSVGAPPLRLLTPDGTDLLSFAMRAPRRVVPEGKGGSNEGAEAAGSPQSSDYDLQVRTGLMGGWRQLEATATLLHLVSRMLWEEVREVKFTGADAAELPWEEYRLATGDCDDTDSSDASSSAEDGGCASDTEGGRGVERRRSGDCADSDGDDTCSSSDSSDSSTSSPSSSDTSECSDESPERPRRRAKAPTVSAVRKRRRVEGSEGCKANPSTSASDGAVTPRPDARRAQRVAGATAPRAAQSQPKLRPLPPIPADLPTSLSRLLTETMAAEVRAAREQRITLSAAQHCDNPTDASLGCEEGAGDASLLSIALARDRLMPKLAALTVHALRQHIKASMQGAAAGGAGVLKMRKQHSDGHSAPEGSDGCACGYAINAPCASHLTLKEQLMDTVCEIVFAECHGRWDECFARYLQLPVARGASKAPSRTPTPPPTPAPTPMREMPSPPSHSIRRNNSAVVPSLDDAGRVSPKAAPAPSADVSSGASPHADGGSGAYASAHTNGAASSLMEAAFTPCTHRNAPDTVALSVDCGGFSLFSDSMLVDLGPDDPIDQGPDETDDATNDDADDCCREGDGAPLPTPLHADVVVSSDTDICTLNTIADGVVADSTPQLQVEGSADGGATRERTSEASRESLVVEAEAAEAPLQMGTNCSNAALFDDTAADAEHAPSGSLPSSTPLTEESLRDHNVASGDATTTAAADDEGHGLVAKVAALPSDTDSDETI